MRNLASEIRRGLWALDVSNIELYAPVVEAILTGKNIEFKGVGRATSLFGILDESGNLKNPDKDGNIDLPPNSIAQVSMVGEIIKYGDLCTYGADEIVDALYKAQNNPNVDATVMHFDGPGGSVAAIDLIRDFKANKTKPIIGLVDDALSLHFWTLVELCDYKIMNGNVSPRVGSVGVMATATDYAKALLERGIIKHEIFSDHSEHKNLAFIQALKGEYGLIKKESLNPLALKFQEAVRLGCPNLVEEEGVLTGKTFYADEALRLGMIDEIGSKKTAVAKARALALKQKVSSINN